MALTHGAIMEKLRNATVRVDNPLSRENIMKLCGFTKEERQMISIYWNPNFNSSWIYLSDYIVQNTLTNNTARNVMTKYHKKVEDLFTINEQYQYVSSTHPVVQEYYKNVHIWEETNTLPDGERIETPINFHTNKLFMLVTGECFKALLMMSKTEKGDKLRQYYIKCESFASASTEYFAYINELKSIELLKERDIEISSYQQEKLREAERANRLRDAMTRIPTISNTPGYVYLLKTTHPDYNSLIKLGRCVDLKSRLRTYLTGDKSAHYVRTWEVADKHIAERMLFDLYSEIRVNPKSEWLICYDEDELIEDIDSFIIDLNERLNKPKISKYHDRYANDFTLNIPKDLNITRSRATRSKSPQRTSNPQIDTESGSETGSVSRTKVSAAQIKKYKEDHNITEKLKRGGRQTIIKNIIKDSGGELSSD